MISFGCSHMTSWHGTVYARKKALHEAHTYSHKAPILHGTGGTGREVSESRMSFGEVRY